MTLAGAHPGQVLRITAIADPAVRVQALRFGIAEGEEVICREAIPAGPVVIRRNHQELALGRHLAGLIDVAEVGWTSDD